MIIVNDPCSRCKNALEIEGEYGEPRCNAFPEGIPYEYLWEKDATQLKECNNGYEFEEE